MAKIHQHERQLERDSKTLIRRRLLHKLVVVVAVLFILFNQWQGEQVIGTIMATAVVVLSMRRYRHLQNQLGRVTAGLAGEDKALRLLAELPHTYTVFPDVRVVVGQKASQLDTIVVGPSGVFVVEVKNYAGFIEGNAVDQKLRHIKRRSGETTFYNPVKQVTTHAYRLHQYLQQNQLDIWVQGTVYFANASAKINVANSTNIPIFSAYTNGSKRLLYYIEERQGQALSKREQQRIEKLLRGMLV